jgi:hypothetical protein
MSPLSEKPDPKDTEMSIQVGYGCVPPRPARGVSRRNCRRIPHCGGAAGEHHQILMADRNCETCFAVVRNVRLVTRPPSVHSPKPGCNFACHIIRSPGSFSGVVPSEPPRSPAEAVHPSGVPAWFSVHSECEHRRPMRTASRRRRSRSSRRQNRRCHRGCQSRGKEPINPQGIIVTQF